MLDNIVDVSYLIWLPLAPLLGAALLGALSLGSAHTSSGIDKKLSGTLAMMGPLIVFGLTCVAFTQLGSISQVVQDVAPYVDQHRAPILAPAALTQHLGTWFTVMGVDINWALSFDNLTAFMLLFITGIGSLIVCYSIGYMGSDRGLTRFLAYLNLFLASMIILVLGASLPVTFLGWEGVGLCSYLLIGFWNNTDENNAAANKAFIVNRVGDLGVLIGILALVILVGEGGDLSYHGLQLLFLNHGPQIMASEYAWLVTLAAGALFFGCTAKSAQVPLFTWLPDAMAGPTPVSALIHAATMVTSGIYLCARMSSLLVLTPMVMHIILMVALATAVYAAITALYQWDIKKVLAYSTVSQLGFMFMAVGVGAFDVALFHVVTHAFFKATLFLGAGSVIHGLHHATDHRDGMSHDAVCQDMRVMGGLTKAMPLTHTSMWFAWFAIIGGPLSAGFMSKDLILERLAAEGGIHWLAWAIAVGTALLTALYMSRMMYLTFWSPSRVDHPDHVHEAPLLMSVPVLILGLASLMGGWFLWVALPLPGVPAITTLQAYLAPVVDPAQYAWLEYAHDGKHHHMSAGMIYLLSAIGVGAALIGWFVARKKYQMGLDKSEHPPAPLAGAGLAITTVFDRVYQDVFVGGCRALGCVWTATVERGIGFTSLILSALLQGASETVRSLQPARARVATGMSVLGIVVITVWVLFDIMVGG